MVQFKALTQHVVVGTEEIQKNNRKVSVLVDIQTSHFLKIF
jgi:hypothetical protein